MHNSELFRVKAERKGTITKVRSFTFLKAIQFNQVRLQYAQLRWEPANISQGIIGDFREAVPN